MKNTIFGLLGSLLLGAPAVAQDQFDYTTNADNSLTITRYSGTNAAVTIPSTIDGLSVTAIGDFAFYESYGLTDITIPDSVVTIGDSAFEECSRLTLVILTNGIVSIGNSAFNNCFNLSAISIPATVSIIGQEALNGCSSLPEIAVDVSSSFYCSSNGVLFDKNLTTLVQFPSGMMGSYAIPSSVTNIIPFAFSGAYGLTSVTIPGSINCINDYSFRGCYGLTNATVMSGVSNIGEQAFFDCPNLMKFTIPLGVTNIGHSAFEYCSSLSSLIIPGSVVTIGTAACSACGSLANVVIGEGVTTIDSSAFYDCSALLNITMPTTVSSISGFAFFGCDNLNGVYFEGDAPILGESVFKGNYVDYPTIYYLPGTDGWASFATNTDAPTVLWDPLIQTGDGNLGVRNNQFGFDITGTADIPIVVEACTNLGNPIWVALQSLALTNGLFYFGDPQWTNYSARYYRISSP